MFTISEFWERCLRVTTRGLNEELKGWQHIESELPTFLEAPLNLAQGFGNANPMNSSVILVSAPGAVGKSTLARHISFKTGAMLLDLAEAGPVGANTLVGGLAITNLYQAFKQGNASLIIDGLDEARMRVTEDGFVAFINDVVKLSGSNRKPIILFGRTGAVQEAWLWLSERGMEVPVLEIGYYNQAQAAEFAKIQVQSIRKEPYKREPDGRAIDLILERLKNDLQTDQNSFSGYAPVLIALAKRVADPDTANTQALISGIEQGEEEITLAEISDSILSREQRKLNPLKFQDQTLHDRLYTPEEQIRRLVARLYDREAPTLPLDMSAQDRQIYNGALETWVPEHPFLDGTGRRPSSAVFGGLLASKALHMESTNRAALFMEFGRGTSVNPFLAEFYLSELKKSAIPGIIQADHVGILYASLRARLSQGEAANLRIDGEIEMDNSRNETTEVEITRTMKNGEELEPLYFNTDPEGHFRFGSPIEGVDIDASSAEVSIGYGFKDVVFIAPVSVDTKKITFEAGHMVAEASLRTQHSEFDGPGVVSLKTQALEAQHVTRSPTIRAM